MNYIVLTPAKQELINAIDFYNEKNPHSGYKLLIDFEKTVERIIQNPEAWHPLTKNTRRCLLSKYPYGIIYQIREHIIYIVVFMNMKRKPDYWKKMIKKRGFEE